MSDPYEDEQSTDPRSSADTGPAAAEPASSRGLADILREAGISPAGAGGRRRRRDEPDTAADRAADRGAAADSAGTDEPDRDDRTDVGGLSSYLRSTTGTPARDNRRAERPPPQSDTAATASDRAQTSPPRTDTGPVPTQGWRPSRTSDPESSAASPTTTAGSPATGATAASTPTRSTTAASTPTKATASRAAEPGSTAAPAHANRSSSPLATGPAEDPDEEDSATPLPSGSMSWAILAVELLAALGLGVAAWYGFSALWDLLPYVAAFAGPLVVTGLVAVAGALRARTGRDPLGLPTLCILVFAGTVLVVLPAATLIVP